MKNTLAILAFLFGGIVNGIAMSLYAQSHSFWVQVLWACVTGFGWKIIFVSLDQISF